MMRTNIRRTACACPPVLAASRNLAARRGGLNDTDQTTGSTPSAAASAMGSKFFVPGTIGDPLDAVGDQTQQDLDCGTVLFIGGDDLGQAHVLSPTRRDRTLPVTQAAAGASEQKCPPSP